MAVSALIGPAIGAGISALGGLFGGGGDDTPSPRTSTTTTGAQDTKNITELIRDLAFKKAPEFEEAAGARGQWWDLLQKWGGMPGFGAIAPNWEDIWERAKERVRGVYRGTAISPGVLDRVRSSAAARGVSQSPALETEIGRAGMQEAGDIRNIATEQAFQEAQFGEQGRQNFMQQLIQLAGLKPQVGMFTPSQTSTQTGYVGPRTTTSEQTGGINLPSQTAGLSDLFSAIGPAVGKGISAYGQQNWMEEMLKKYGSQGGAK